MRLEKVIASIALLVILAMVVPACGSSDESPTPEPTQIQTTPDFTGDITGVQAIGHDGILGTILVEGTDTIRSSDKYVVSITDETLILRQDGDIIDRITFAELEGGHAVQVWFSGPVRESYPAQVDAAQVMTVEPADSNEVGLGEELSLGVGQTVAIAGERLEITFQEVINDSRCPRDVLCVWAGEVKVRATITVGDTSDTVELTQPGTMGEFSQVSHNGYDISFRVDPYPTSDTEIQPEEYVLDLIVTRSL